MSPTTAIDPRDSDLSDALTLAFDAYCIAFDRDPDDPITLDWFEAWMAR